MFGIKKTEDIRAKAFFMGTQDVNQADALKEIEADFETKREDVNLRATDEIKHLEAETEIANARKTDAESRWKMLDSLAGGRTPEFTKPALAVVVAFVLIAAEGLLLSAVIDGLNIVIFWVQWVVATVMVTALSGLLKWSVHSFRQMPRKLWQVILPATFSLVALGVFGWWRGEEVVFAGQQIENGNTFAAENAFLTKVLLTLVTIALPTLAAVALEFGLEKLRFWKEHSTAKSDFFRFGKLPETNRKRLESANEKRDIELERVKKERESWLFAARDAFETGRETGAHKRHNFRDASLTCKEFETGRETGAHKRPLWTVLFSTAVVGVLIFVSVMVFAFVFVDQPLSLFIENDAFRFGLFLLTVAGLTGLFAIHAFRKRDRPTAKELFRERVTHFRNTEHPNDLKTNEGAQKPLPASADEDVWNEETIVTTR